MDTTTISIKYLKEGLHIFKPNYHMNYGKKRINNMTKAGREFNNLGELTDSIYTGGIFKRIFVSNPDYGIPYISAQHMMNNNPIESAKIISKKFTPRQHDMTLKEGQILVSCAGSVGNVRFITSDLDGIIGSQDIIRVVPNENKAPSGFIYAYLSSPTAYKYIQSYIYGSVVPRIEPNTLSQLPIPKFSDSKKTKIHQLVVEAMKLRVESNRHLKVAQDKLLEEIKIKVTKQLDRRLNIVEIKNSYTKRFEGSYFLNEGHAIKKQIQNSLPYKQLKDLCKPIFRPGIFKRVYVKNGITFLGGGDIIKASPNSEKKLSKTRTKGLAELIVRDNWILATCGGTIGFTLFVDGQIDGYAASQHILRIIPENIKPGYLYAFLSSHIGVKLIQSYSYGSVIPQIEPHHIERIPIPLLKPDIEHEIHKEVMEYKSKITRAKANETSAIQLIENEIESWQN